MTQICFTIILPGPAVKERVNKKAQYGTTMSLAKISIQIAIEEGATAELLPFSKWLIRCLSLRYKKHKTQKHKNTNDQHSCDKYPIRLLKYIILFIKKFK